MALKRFSFKVNGLNSIHGADVIMVQETNFRPGGSFRFASKLFPTAFVASDPPGKAGVAILIKRSSPI